MRCLLFMLSLTLLCAPAYAGKTPSPALMGVLGLNTVPTARMDKGGTMRVAVAALDPYVHATIGLQASDALYIGIRQTAQATALRDDPDRLYPGIDLRLRLWKESEALPQIALGLQSAIGHKRMAGEYLVLSKRYKDFDFTGGIAWGRLGSAAHVKNPLKALNKHFGKDRSLNGEMPNEPNNWFTGEDVGFFAGAEYFVPQVKGLSVKADFGADRYIVERALFNYDAPAPWTVGLNFSPVDWVDFGAAVVGGEKFMGQMTVQSPLQNWFGRKHSRRKSKAMRAYRTGLSLPAEMAIAAAREDIRLYEMRGDDYSAMGKLLLDPYRPTPLQIGRAARRMADHAGESIEGLSVTPMSYGLEGYQVTLLRRDLEQALVKKQGSPQEIWRNLRFDPAACGKDIWHDRFQGFDNHYLRLILDNEISLSEDDNGLLYRTALLLEEERKLSEHFWVGGTLRGNLADNLYHLNEFRPRAVLPVRSNVDEFTDRTISLDRSYLGWMTTLKPDLHVKLMGGMLEEMYAGFGGEALYRPFGKTFAIGAEAWQVFKRDPDAAFNLGLNGDHLLTGHVQAWYEFPDSDLTLQARIGRYLAEDTGGTLALSRHFDNGVEMEAFVTATNAADFDIFGSATHLYSGLKLTLPLGQAKFLPEGSAARFTAAPLGRDAGQALDAPMKLYEISEPLSYRHMERHWTKVTD